MRIGILAALTVLLIAPQSEPGASPQQGPLRVVTELDYGKFAGTWYEIARLPNRFEEKCASDVTAVYAPRPDGRISVTNSCREADGRIRSASGIARRVDGRPPSVLKVRFAPAFLSFLPFVWGDYQVIDLGPAYEYALVGSPDRQYLWVLSRTPHVDLALYGRLVERARAQGFDVSALIETRHTKP